MRSTSFLVEPQNQGRRFVSGLTSKPLKQFVCDESLTCGGLNSNLGHFGCFTFILVSFRESRLLISLCVGGRYSMAGSNEDYGRSRRPDADDRG
jgi:hypothetical protein